MDRFVGSVEKSLFNSLSNAFKNLELTRLVKNGNC
jgi:hypothetical protein